MDGLKMDPEYPRVTACGMIKSGFWKFHEIVENIIISLNDGSYADLTREDMYEMAMVVVDEEWNEALELQKDWPDVVEGDLIEKIFYNLAMTHDYLTSMYLPVCPPFATPEESGLVKDFDDQGYVVFSEYHVACAVNGGPLIIVFGTFSGDLEATLDVGATVMRQLIDAGFDVYWSGLPNDSIVINNIEWRRRLPQGGDDSDDSDDSDDESTVVDVGRNQTGEAQAVVGN